MTLNQSRPPQRPSNEEILQAPKCRDGELELNIGVNLLREAAYSDDYLRVLEDLISKDRQIDVQWWLRLREELKERARGTNEGALEPITLHKIWQAEVRSARERNPELFERRFQEHLTHGGTLADWDPLTVLGVLPFELWLKKILQGEDYHRSSATKCHRGGALLTRRVAHLIVYGDLGGSDIADG